MPDSRAERFEEIFNSNAPSVLAFALRRLADPGDAAEVMAEVFTIAWRRLDDVPTGDDARLWLFGTARFVVQNEHRRRRRTAALAQRLRSELLAQPPLVNQPDASGRVRLALDQLSVDDRELLMLTGWDGLTPSQSATVLGVPADVVRVRLHRARHRLREALANLDDGEKHPATLGQVGVRSAAVALPDSKENP